MYYPCNKIQYSINLVGGKIVKTLSMKKFNIGQLVEIEEKKDQIGIGEIYEIYPFKQAS